MAGEHCCPGWQEGHFGEGGTLRSDSNAMTGASGILPEEEPCANKYNQQL